MAGRLIFFCCATSLIILFVRRKSIETAFQSSPELSVSLLEVEGAVDEALDSGEPAIGGATGPAIRNGSFAGHIVWLTN